MRGMKTAKKMRPAHYWDATFLTQIVPSYYFTVTKQVLLRVCHVLGILSFFLWRSVIVSFSGFSIYIKSIVPTSCLNDTFRDSLQKSIIKVSSKCHRDFDRFSSPFLADFCFLLCLCFKYTVSVF